MVWPDRGPAALRSGLDVAAWKGRRQGNASSVSTGKHSASPLDVRLVHHLALESKRPCPTVFCKKCQKLVSVGNFLVRWRECCVNFCNLIRMDRQLTVKPRLQPLCALAFQTLAVLQISENTVDSLHAGGFGSEEHLNSCVLEHGKVAPCCVSSCCGADGCREILAAPRHSRHARRCSDTANIENGIGHLRRDWNENCASFWNSPSTLH
mmetsp:Transcript_41679/g.99909  ORF Transcript_41679/g.99909 Transcript_41679/m.99909 type:complete len:209 (+) Transcript_41679:421-1047(+)